MTLIAVVATLVAGCVLILCLPAVAVAVVRGDGGTMWRLSVAVALCMLLIGVAGAYLASATPAGLSLGVWPAR